MWTADVLAKIYGVPLVLGPDGKTKAIALAVLRRSNKQENSNMQRGATWIVPNLVRLGDAHELDGILGGFHDNRATIANSFIDSSDSPPASLTDLLVEEILDALTAYLAKHPSAIGQPDR